MYCQKCGSAIDPEVNFCIHCGAPVTVQPAAGPPGPPLSKKNDVAGEESFPGGTTPARSTESFRIAGLGDRFLAVFLDTVLISAGFAIIGMVYSIGYGGITESGFELNGLPALLVISTTMAVGFLYYWLGEAWFGRTLGKALAGIRVVSKDGSRCGIRKSLIRNLLRVIDGIGVYLVGFLVAILSHSRQRLGDHAAGTVVVDHSPGKAARVTAVVVWLLLVAGGVLGAYLLHHQTPPWIVATPEGTAPAAEIAPQNVPAAEVSLGKQGISTDATGSLRLIEFHFLESNGGAVRAQRPYHPEETVYSNYRVGGVSRDDQSRIKVDLLAVTTDPDSVPLHRPKSQQIRGKTSSDTVHGSYSVALPPYAPPGIYTMNITVLDLLAGSKILLKPQFTVEAPAPLISSKFEMRDFVLSSSRGGEPADPVVLHGSGTVYMQCKMAGMTVRDGGVDFRIRFKVTGPDGNVLLDKPDYFHNRDKFFYRPAGFYLPIHGDLTLPGGIKTGTYKLEYRATDHIGNTETRRTATVEVR